MGVALPARASHLAKPKDIGFAWDLIPFNTNAYIIVDIYEEVHVNKKGS